NPGDAALSLAKGAHDRGATFAYPVTVTGFRIIDGAVTGVETDKGLAEADTVVLAAGLWRSELARLAGTSVALYPAEHVWAATERLPLLREAHFQHYLRAPESFTPDANLHLGEFPEVRNLFVAAGLNSQGIIYAPGVGKALAEWIVESHPTMDLTEVDVART